MKKATKTSSFALGNDNQWSSTASELIGWHSGNVLSLHDLESFP